MARRGAWSVLPAVGLLVAGWLAAGCGGGAGGGGGAQPPVLGVCTGPVPANASPCPGAEAGLASDAPRVVLASSCACQAPCTATPCAYLCNVGYRLGDDGRCAVAPDGGPIASLVDNGDGTVGVTDVFGHATWLADASCAETAAGGPAPPGPLTWYQATDWSAQLSDGACGLRDGSRPGDWRLPTQTQLMHLQVDLGVANPFVGVQAGVYWSSWTYWADKAGAVDLYTGEYFEDLKVAPHHVWPVR